MDTGSILVCGGRDFINKQLMWEVLDAEATKRGWTTEQDEYGNWLPTFTMIHGAAKGADSIVDEYAVVNWLVFKEFPADWEKYGKKAGPIRNQQMLDEGKPDLVIAFPTPKSRGTWDMVRRAQKANIETIIVEANGPITENSQ